MSFLSNHHQPQVQLTKNMFNAIKSGVKACTLLAAISASLFLSAAQAETQHTTSSDNAPLLLTQLGGYQLDFEKITAVDHINGQNLLASSQTKPGENFSMYLPFSVQHSQFLIANGSKVTKGQAVAILSGYDVHHFLEEYQAAKTLFSNAKQHYQTSLGLYQQKALSQSRWTEISNSYFAAKLHFGHLNHLKEFLSISPFNNKSGNKGKSENANKGDDEIVSIISPITGTLRYFANSNVKQEGELLFDVIPHHAMRLKISAPLKKIKQLSKVKVLNHNCVIDIDTTSTQNALVHNFSTTVWSVPITDTCNITLGESLVVSPIYQQAAFSINKSALFEIDNRDHIAIKKGQQLELVAVELLGSSEGNYLFTSQVNLTEKSVLTSSVSAVQGILLELGSGE